MALPHDFWLALTNAALGLLVAVPVLAVAIAVLREIFHGRRPPPYEWVDVPGVGILPVLRHSPPRRRGHRGDLALR
jgi:hypothetical protein